jgi:hypothetical protein
MLLIFPLIAGEFGYFGVWLLKVFFQTDGMFLKQMPCK